MAIILAVGVTGTTALAVVVDIVRGSRSEHTLMLVAGLIGASGACMGWLFRGEADAAARKETFRKKFLEPPSSQEFETTVEKKE